ncbi:hypothetical protein FPJ27_14190 [Burkholderia sp. MS455]|nr:hypothetical protein FPJ27_14190 [Burkholderia sp. MS455]
MGDRRCLTHAAAGISPFFRSANRRGQSLHFDMALCAVMRVRRLTPFFFRSRPEFTSELLLNYFFVIWLDRHA